MPEPRDPAVCPLCGQPNECGAVRGATTCWCFSAEIPHDVLARIPDADRGMRCVCAACASPSAAVAADSETDGGRR